MTSPSLARYVFQFFLWVFGIALLVGGVAFWYWGGQVEKARGNTKETITFVLAKGESAVALATDLESKGIIQSKFPFLYYVMRSRLQSKLQSGTYALSGNLSIPEIVGKFIEGKVIPPGVKVTFPEGFTAQMMADRLTAANLPGKDFLAIITKPYPKWQERYSFLASLPSGASFEGYLFPDTYIFPKEATGELIVNEFLKTFEKKALPLFVIYPDKTKLTAYQSLILASILEEEGKNAEERRIISDIFLKRLLKNQPLQSDATINYALGTTKMQPTLKDIESASPYNTYRNSGLPPGPISNPGLESLTAALNPLPNDYYYFLNDIQTGETVFSKTFEEHVQNRERHGL